MSYQPGYTLEQLDNQSMGLQSNGTPAIALVVPYAVEEPGTNLVL